MGKFLLELALFAGILCQISMLIHHAAPPAAAVAVPAPQHYALHKDALQDMARQEAERIIATGDVESLQKQIDNNRVLLNLMGYNL